ncbi:MAG: hypothetical protein JNM84_06740 [Planctomycetes bacterium]|nr:hypothetical protein [Planctomycetota bacterium]
MRQLLACFLLGSVLCAATGYAADVHVGTHGAFANDNRDDRAKIQDAIQACQPGDRLLFRPGIYDLWNQGTPLALSLSGKSQLEIDGRGCTLRLHGFDIVNPGSYANVFFGEGCDQIWIHDLVIDMVREPFSVGQVVATSSNNTVVSIQFDPGFPVVGRTFIETMMSYDDQGRPDGSSCDRYFQTPLRGTLVGPQTLEFTLPSAASLGVSQLVVVRHKVYGANAFTFRNSARSTCRGSRSTPCRAWHSSARAAMASRSRVAR